MEFTQEQAAGIKQLLSEEPCLFNARHYKDYLTMANWINEVSGKQLITPDEVKTIMEPSAEELAAAGAPVQRDDWSAQAGKLADLGVISTTK